MQGDPIENLKLTKTDWEKIMLCLDNDKTHKLSVYMKYQLQCMIDTAEKRGEWI